MLDLVKQSQSQTIDVEFQALLICIIVKCGLVQARSALQDGPPGCFWFDYPLY